MGITKERLLAGFDSLSNKAKVMVISSIILLGIYTMYVVTLKPYIDNYFALKKELSSFQTLLDSKLMRTEAIDRLKGVRTEYLSILGELNTAYFSPEESDLFVKTLPEVINSFGNEVSSLKPVKQGTSMVRNIIFKEYLDTLPKSKNKEKTLYYLNLHKQDINAGKRMNIHLREIAKRIRKNQGDLRRVWVQAKDIPLAEFHMSKINIELEFKGTYGNILEVFQWFEDQENRMEITELYIEPHREEKNKLDVHLFMAIYTMEEDLYQKEENHDVSK